MLDVTRILQGMSDDVGRWMEQLSYAPEYCSTSPRKTRPKHFALVEVTTDPMLKMSRHETASYFSIGHISPLRLIL